MLQIGKKYGDHHEEVDGKHFEKLFENVMPKLKPNSIDVMDNAPYHSVKEKIPTSSWTESTIQERLSKMKIMWNRDMIKISKLLQKISEVKHLYDSYRADEIVQKHLTIKF
ncbi:DDE_3 domain-containing protein [Nephila pilipes]|uniref:DDE_3 domain-containing protein n=1 Tax=Nephila pilipes TaxID=299642 RepID=A0A8X6NIJ4_NEPPI|nr:DDE_3 domain-containing protein [Nephila pilipes]